MADTSLCPQREGEGQTVAVEWESLILAVKHSLKLATVSDGSVSKGHSARQAADSAIWWQSTDQLEPKQ